MKQLLFLYNELLDENYQKKLRLPLEFISFAYIDNALMYDICGRYIAIEDNTLVSSKKYNRVYGALYILDNAEHYLRTLDASLICSRGLIGKNHKLDEFHRVNRLATPIHFKTIEDFLKLKYNESEQINIITYLANTENEFIKSKVNNSTKNRETCGFDINNFINLVLKEKE